MTEGYVYYVKELPGRPQQLDPTLVAHLGEPVVHWVASKAVLVMHEGLPETWGEQGAMFGPKGELRWWRQDGVCRALLIVDESLEGFAPVPGRWRRKSQSVLLQDLNERRVNPNFSTYPHGAHDGVMEVQVFYRDGMPVFISPRRLQKTEG